MTRLKTPHRFAALVILLPCVLAGIQSAQAQSCNKSPDDIRVVSDMKDIGADFAVVVAAQSTIYEQPDASSKALLRVKRSEILALVKRDPLRTWYRVIEVDSATEGWIDECDVIIKLTAHQELGPPVEEERVGTTEDPQLSVANLEPATNLNLHLNGTLYIIPANTTKNFTLKPGKYEFYGYSPGVRPAFGSNSFKAGYKYSWTFKIVVH